MSCIGIYLNLTKFLLINPQNAHLTLKYVLFYKSLAQSKPEKQLLVVFNFCFGDVLFCLQLPHFLSHFIWCILRDSKRSIRATKFKT